MQHESPSGIAIMGAAFIEHDWGDVPPGQHVVYAPVPFNAAGVEVTTPYQPCPFTPFPKDTLTVCAPANDQGQPACYLQCNNFTGSPIAVGKKKYVVLFYQLRYML